MEIDWFTVIAQLVNFLILVWLLQRFLYKPVLNAIDQREKRVASQLEDAAVKKAEARKEKDLFIQKNEAFDREHAAKLEEAHTRVKSEQQRLYEEARKESTALRLKLEDSLKQQEQEFKAALKLRTKEEVFAIAGKALSDLANTDLEEQVINVFIGKIKRLDERDRTKFISALKVKDGPIRIKSVFELSRNSKQTLEKTIEEITDKETGFEYVLEPKLVSGIMLETADFQLSWSIESYLQYLKIDSTTK